MKRVVLFGNGHVGSHLATAIESLDGYRIVYHYTRSKGGIITDIPRDADIYLFAIPDSALAELWSLMPPTTGVWLHTAGSVSLEEISKHHGRSGVIYPLQTFTKGKALEWSSVPVYYEGDDEVKALAHSLSPLASYADSRQRARMHLAAVVACNFSNYLISIAEGILQEAKVHPKALQPLLHEMVNKLDILSAKEAQTGPALRRDENTMHKHMQMLEKEHVELYRILSEGIRAMSK